MEPEACHPRQPNGLRHASPGQASNERRPGITEGKKRTLKGPDNRCPGPPGLMIFIELHPGRRACRPLAGADISQPFRLGPGGLLTPQTQTGSAIPNHPSAPSTLAVALVAPLREQLEIPRQEKLLIISEPPCRRRQKPVLLVHLRSQGGSQVLTIPTIIVNHHEHQRQAINIP